MFHLLIPTVSLRRCYHALASASTYCCRYVRYQLRILFRQPSAALFADGIAGVLLSSAGKAHYRSLHAEDRNPRSAALAENAVLVQLVPAFRTVNRFRDIGARLRPAGRTAGAAGRQIGSAVKTKRRFGDIVHGYPRSAAFAEQSFIRQNGSAVLTVHRIIPLICAVIH